ncbi:hypothetical protein ACMD2_16544 [Ananas comosus]|uniref:Uncharacterized protein n=1 Tax=Ananas comosus TaxID=4615 RepID=A0A199VXU2_ANACO|nr:hypothetical protein ACMD2_16544 [Ananas comosus]
MPMHCMKTFHKGRETTSSTLTWFFWIVSARFDVEKKILEEIRIIIPSYAYGYISCEEDNTMSEGTFEGKGWFVTYVLMLWGYWRTYVGSIAVSKSWRESPLARPDISRRAKNMLRKGNGFI